MIVHDFSQSRVRMKWRSGYRFCVRQAGGRTNRRYYVFFELDKKLQLKWVGGVKATAGTWELVRRVQAQAVASRAVRLGMGRRIDHDKASTGVTPAR